MGEHLAISRLSRLECFPLSNHEESPHEVGSGASSGTHRWLPFSAVRCICCAILLCWLGTFLRPAHYSNVSYASCVSQAVVIGGVNPKTQTLKFLMRHQALYPGLGNRPSLVHASDVQRINHACSVASTCLTKLEDLCERCDCQPTIHSFRPLWRSHRPIWHDRDLKLQLMLMQNGRYLISEFRKFWCI